MLSSNHTYTTVIRWTARIITFFCICLLLTGIPASATRMGSVDVNGSEVAYQAQYKAYTEAAASGKDSLVCYFTVSNPTAGKNGALCRMILPQSKNVYLYMDNGALAVMRYDGSEYKKFSADYQLKQGQTYTLCIFLDGLVLFDGIRCYTYSGNFYGLSDVAAGWSDESNVFSTKLTKKAPSSTAASTDTQETDPVSTETQTTSVSNPYPSIWVILALLLGTTSNLLALVALRSSNMALRTVYRVLSPARSTRHRQTASTQAVSRPAQSKTRQPAPPKQSRKPAAKPPASKRSSKQTTAKQPVNQQQKNSAQPSRRSQSVPTAHTASKPASSRPAEKRKPTLFFTDELQESAPKQAPAQKNTQLLPIDLYTGTLWRAHTDRMVPYHFGNAGMGYCIFSPGSGLSAEMFVRIGEEDYIWLNPVRFHAESAGSGVLLRMSEIAGIAMAFDFYHVHTGKREIAIPYDVHMVQFHPAQVKPNTHDTLELSQRGMIMFEPVQ